MTTRAGEVRPPAEARVWLLALGIALAAIALWCVLGREASPQSGPLDLAWWALLPMVVAGQASAVHFQVRRQAQSISMCHVVLVLGLVCTDPLSFVLTRAFGGAVAMATFRRQRGLKLALNTASYSLEAVVAVSLLHVLDDLPTPVALYVVMAISDLTSFCVVRTAIAVFERHVELTVWLRPLTWLLPINFLATSWGLLAVAALWRGGGYLVPLTGVTLAVLLFHRSYDRLHTRHVDMGRVQSLAISLPALTPESAELGDVVEQARQLLMAERAHLWLPDGTHVQAAQDVAPRSVRTDTPPTAPARPPRWRRRPFLTGVSTPVRLEGHDTPAVLSVEDRMGAVRAFDTEDARLLAAVGALLGGGLDRGAQRQKLLDAERRDALTDSWTLPEASRRAAGVLERGDAQGLLVVDVIGLQDVNDSLGHDAGDAVLRLTAQRLTHHAEAGAVVARSGGDEFLALLPRGGRPPADIVRQASGRIEIAGARLELRLRAGFCAAVDGESFDHLVRNAQAALARAARDGSQYGHWTSALRVDPSRRLRLAGDLQTALAHGDVFPVFQPLSRTRDLAVVGAEALARWRHPDLGAIPPDEFIAIAEQTGLIGEVTSVMLERSLRQARRWRDEGRALRVSVNLSPRSLSDGGIVAAVRAALERHHVPADALLLEITESSIMTDLAQSLSVLAALRAEGVHLALDDFGTGHSSLTQLRTIPVDEVKLDRSFLSGVLEDEASRRIVATAVALCHDMGKLVVAEGVEDQATVDFLREAGVDLLQGYHLGRPMPAEDWPTTRVRPPSTVPAQRARPRAVRR